MNNNKKILIGLGVLAAAGLAYYLWKKDKSEDATETKTGGEKKASAIGRIGNGMSLGSPKISNATVGNCTSDQIAKGTHINCSSKGVAGFCCLAPKKAATLTIVN